MESGSISSICRMRRRRFTRMYRGGIMEHPTANKIFRTRKGKSWRPSATKYPPASKTTLNRTTFPARYGSRAWSMESCSHFMISNFERKVPLDEYCWRSKESGRRPASTRSPRSRCSISWRVRRAGDHQAYSAAPAKAAVKINKVMSVIISRILLPAPRPRQHGGVSETADGSRLGRIAPGRFASHPCRCVRSGKFLPVERPRASHQ